MWPQRAEQIPVGESMNPSIDRGINLAVEPSNKVGHTISYFHDFELIWSVHEKAIVEKYSQSTKTEISFWFFVY